MQGDESSWSSRPGRRTRSGGERDETNEYEILQLAMGDCRGHGPEHAGDAARSSTNSSNFDEHHRKVNALGCCPEGEQRGRVRRASGEEGAEGTVSGVT